MQPPNRSGLCRQGMIILNKIQHDPVFGQNLLVPAFTEEASSIPEPFRGEDLDAGKWRIFDLHRVSIVNRIQERLPITISIRTVTRSIHGNMEADLITSAFRPSPLGRRHATSPRLAIETNGDKTALAVRNKVGPTEYFFSDQPVFSLAAITHKGNNGCIRDISETVLSNKTRPLPPTHGVVV